MDDIHLVAFDLDGTLLDGRSQIRPDALNALARIQREGVFITLMTGRPFSATEGFAREIGLMTPFGVNHGARVADLQGIDIVKRVIPEVGVREAVEISTRRDCIPFIQDAEEPGSLTLLEEHKGHPLVEYTLRSGDNGEGMLKDKARFVPSDEVRTPALSFYSAGKKEDVARLVEEARAQTVPLYHVDRFPVQAKGASEEIREKYEVALFSPVGADKGTALAAVADTLGVRMENTLAFGDWHNDLPMLQAAGHAVVMGNAPPEILAELDSRRVHRTGTNDSTGIVDALVRVGLV